LVPNAEKVEMEIKYRPLMRFGTLEKHAFAEQSNASTDLIHGKNVHEFELENKTLLQSTANNNCFLICE